MHVIDIANKEVRSISKALNKTPPIVFVDSFIAVTQPDHLMSLKINV